MSFPFFRPLRGRHAVRLSARATFAGAALGIAIVCTNALAGEAPLTIAEAQRLATRQSRQLTGMDASIAASRDMAVAADQLPDPVLKLGIDNLPISGPDRLSLTSDFMTMRRIGVMQELTRPEKRHWRAEGYARTADRTAAEKTAALAAIERSTAIAWLERFYTQAMADLLLAQAAQAQREIAAAEGAYRGGRGGRADILAARSTLAMVGDRASDVGRRLRAAKTILARWTGADAEVALAAMPPIDTIPFDPARLESHLAHHPQIAVLARQEDVAQADAKLAEAGKKTDWSVEVTFQQRGPAYANMLSFGVSVPLQWQRSKRQDRELGAKLALVEQAHTEREEAERTHIAETRTMIDEWQTGRERIARYERELLPLAADRVQALTAAYAGGKATLVDVLAAQRNETETRLQALQVQLDTARVWAQLNFLFTSDTAHAHHSTTTDKAVP